MRIAYETSSLRTDRPTGIVRYAQQLVAAIFHEIAPEDNIRFLYKASRIRYRRHWWRQNGVRIQIYHNSCWPIAKQADILHGMDGFVPNWEKSKKLITIHDLAAIKLNDSNVATRKFQARKLRLYEKVAKYVDAVITVSETTKNDVVNMLNINPEKVHVIHLGVEERYFPQEKKMVDVVLKKYGLQDDYLFYVGGISGLKNTERLVEAFARSRANKGLNLVFTGALSYQAEKTLEAIRKNHLENRVIMLGYITDNDLPAVYSGAKGLVFPTLYEGFGLPILEAMACGVPVLTGNAGAAPEISGKWAIHVDPYDVDDIADGIGRLLDFSPRNLQGAIKHARSFSWKKCAKKSLTVYKQLLEEELETIDDADKAEAEEPDIKGAIRDA